MEDWYSAVRKLRDVSAEPYKTEQFCQHVFQSLRRLKIKDKGKFNQRMGPEFSSWSGGLEPQSLAISILNEDDFWQLTLKVARA